MNFYLSTLLVVFFSLLSIAKVEQGKPKEDHFDYSSLIRYVETVNNFGRGGAALTNSKAGLCADEPLLNRSSFADPSLEYQVASRSKRTPSSNEVFATRLAHEGWVTAGECIPTSKSYQKKYRTKNTCDRSKSGWACLRGVRYAVADALGRPRDSISLGLHAENSGKPLMSLGFKPLKPCNARTAPLGTVLVYHGPGSGHAEIKSKNPSNNGVYYCSDYCSAVPRNEASSKRTLGGCYVM